MNIILVVYDSLRKDCVGCYGPAPWWDVKTPHFDALARESLVMTRMYPESLPTLPTRRALYTGERSNMLVQHIDLAAQILDFAGVQPKQPLDGKKFWEASVAGGDPIRDHVTVAWGSAVTVIEENWWLNGKVNGKGVFLRDVKSENPFESNVADDNPDIVQDLFNKAVADAGGVFPDYLVTLAEGQSDAPGCSELASRK